MQDGLFSSKLLAGWLAAVSLTFALSMYLITTNATPQAQVESAGPTVYSKSAIGFYVLLQMFKQLHVPVMVNNGLADLPHDYVVIVHEPDMDRDAERHVRDVFNSAASSVLVLPKRKWNSDALDQGRIAAASLLPVADVAKVAALTGISATVTRNTGPKKWASTLPTLGHPVIWDVQLLESRGLRPLIWSAQGALVAELRKSGRRIIIVADPDIFENHAIAHGDNAAIAATILDSVRTAKGRLVFDEAAHGFIARPYGAIGLLFRFPFALAMLQIVLAAVLFIWSGSAQFGKPAAPRASLPAGKHSLIESAARLMEFAGGIEFLGDRYSEVLLRDAAARLHAPRSLSDASLAEWFAKTGREIPLPVMQARGAHSTLTTAQELYAWRNDVVSQTR